ncbi:hypothetical protein ASF61_01500 [Duganella sp. Leaf126]|uniref:YjgN family protein n=1 Tax=Duganella sp. Leaf126 TaxID=1736266 RepID=UPI0007023C5F|nr:YjgN family protein [Duganella sp. Leaf126]KQQ47351.1 hypothetical protein ASF61_01500 [Duganella sp. Leaf126]
MVDFAQPSDPFAPVAPAATVTPPQQLAFHASGSEYFRIWIVNILLSIVTLGIYSAWAKVRRNQYFYSSTELAGSSFEYHGNPLAILKGRIVAAVVVGAYALAGRVSPLLALAMFVVMAAVVPWFVWRSLQFQLHNSAWRGIRFRFDGQLRDAYINCLLRPLLNIVTLGLATPYIYQRLKAWQFNQSRFGQARFATRASVGDFYKLFAAFMLLGIVFVVGFGIVSAMQASAMMAAPTPAEVAARSASFGFWTGIAVAVFYLLILSLTPLLIALIQNLMWNSASLDRHTFRSDVHTGRMLFIIVTNMLAIVCTLGLFLPFAQVRMMRYRIASLTVIPGGSLDAFVATNSADVGAAGEGVSDFMDFDFSL